MSITMTEAPVVLDDVRFRLALSNIKHLQGASITGLQASVPMASFTENFGVLIGKHQTHGFILHESGEQAASGIVVAYSFGEVGQQLYALSAVWVDYEHGDVDAFQQISNEKFELDRLVANPDLYSEVLAEYYRS